ncbi:MAG: Mediator of RNA polymerase II transcription subunit 18 [Vezdaea aestivalis]|nr:MAG: Mediator of RNA polymerase II transcription subunit 18 [Vezdaea aestivalis]
MSSHSMYELSLFATVPESQRAQLLHVLSGLSCMQPSPITIHRQIYSPSKAPLTASRQVGGSQNIEVSKAHQNASSSEQYYHHLEGQKQSTGVIEWTARINHIPEATGRRTVTGRNVSIESVDGHGEGYVAAKSLRYAATFVTEYVVRGWRWVHGSTVLELYQSFTAPTPLEKPPTLAVSAPGSAKPLDPSSSWLLRAYVMINDGSKPELVSKGTETLQNVQMLLRGVVDLEIGDRLALDTRVK